jgi:hypothetical protein
MEVGMRRIRINIPIEKSFMVTERRNQLLNRSKADGLSIVVEVLSLTRFEGNYF